MNCHGVKCAGLAVLLLLACTGEAWGQDSSAQKNGVTVFPASFYAAGGAQTALQVAERTPGFSFNRGDPNLRGLQSGAGNVLVDGRLPTSKALTLSEILERIPFSTIERAELVQAGANGYDMLGHAQVLNIVRSRNAATTLNTEAGALYFTDNRRAWGGTGRLELNRNAGALSTDFALTYNAGQTENAGEGSYVRSGATDIQPVNGAYDADDWQNTGQATLVGRYSWDDLEASLDLSGTDSTLFIDQVTEYRNATGQSFREVVDIDRDNEALELGSNIDATLSADHTLNFKLLNRVESESSDSSRDLGESQVLAKDTFDSTETVLRGLLRWIPHPGLQWEFGAEAAFNSLDSFAAVQVNGQALDLPNAEVTVEEDRYQAFVKATYQLKSDWQLEVGLNYETSTLRQSGDANLKKNFNFPKPRLASTWSLTDKTDLRFRYEKVVGQLSFASFAASPSLESGIISAGNANLEPEESREFELQLQQKFWEEGSITLTYTHARLANALDYIPVGERFDALGNAGKGTKDTLIMNLSLPFDQLGWEGATYRTKLTLYDSEITDPFTGEKREISGRTDFSGSMGFTWELPALKSVLGFDGYWGISTRTYRISEVRLDRELPAPLAFWWDRELDDGFILRLEVFYANLRQRERVREIYPGGRATADESINETRKAVQQPYFMVRLRKRF